jgi:5-methylthioadenosine/S-adenosylhomocysteine deaminase
MGAIDPLFIASTLVVGRDVRTVVINGRVVMKEREILTVDVEEIRHRLARRRPAIMARYDALVA